MSSTFQLCLWAGLFLTASLFSPLTACTGTPTDTEKATNPDGGDNKDGGTTDKKVVPPGCEAKKGCCLSAKILQQWTSHGISNYNSYRNTWSSIALSPDGKYLVSGTADGREVWVWQTEGMKLHKVMGGSGGHTQGVRAVSINKQGTWVASGSYDDHLVIWNIDTGTQRSRTKYNGDIYAVAFNPGGSLVAFGGSGREVRIINAATGKAVHTLKGHSSNVQSLAWSPDGKMLLSGSRDKTARMWDVTEGKELYQFKGNGSYVQGVAFSPDGKKIATAGEDRKGRIYEVETQKELHNVDLGERGRSVSFSPDGKEVAFGVNNSKIVVYKVEDASKIREVTGHSSSINYVEYV